jgi:hypothetical protein
MPDWQFLVITALMALGLYAGAVLALVAVGRRTDAVAVLHGAGPVLVREHWPGPSRSLDAVVRLA